MLTGLGLDHRVGRSFLKPGPGYGGSCLPQDVQALTWAARRAGVRLDLVSSLERANARQRDRLLSTLTHSLGGLAGYTVAVWGLTFKAETDDLHGSVALELIPRLLNGGAKVQAYDPAGMAEFGRQFPAGRWPGLTLAEDPWAALTGADGLLLLTDWDVFRQAPVSRIRKSMAGRVVVDGRNLLDPAESEQAGLHYRGVGRGRWPRR